MNYPYIYYILDYIIFSKIKQGFMFKFSRLKRPLLILGFLLLVVLIGYLLWRTFFQESVSPFTPAPPITELGPGGLPGIGEDGDEPETPGDGTGRLPDGTYPEDDEVDSPVLSPDPESYAPQEVASGGLTEATLVVANKTLNPTLSSDGNVNYYNREDGLFYKLDKQGNITKLSDRVFHQVQKVTWAPNTDKAIIEYPDNTKITYDFNTKKQSTLPSYWEDFSFSPDGEQITSKSIGLDKNNRWLVVANDDSSKAVALEPLGDRADYIHPSWSPNNQIVAYYTKGVDFDRQEVFFVGLHGENYKSTVVEGRGVEAKWSKEGDNLLVSAYHSRDDYKPKLWVVGSSPDNIGAGRRSLELNTWASKCTFASETDVYCAVPQTLEAGAGMFPELADRSQDDLYKINLRTGTKTLIAVPDGAFNISDIVVPEDQSSLYFSDKLNQRLYEVRLR